MTEPFATMQSAEDTRQAPTTAVLPQTPARRAFGPVAHPATLASPLASASSNPVTAPPAATEISARTGRFTAYEAGKRTFDVAAAGIALAALMPFLAVIAVLIWLDDRGPVLYWQTRVGRDGRTFRFYKFRSMVRNADALKEALLCENEAEGPIFKMRRDPRVTRVGRFLRQHSLDELPQFFNVLRGDMSLVGPRPHLPSEVACYTPRQRLRLSVQPGLICLREVHGRSNLTFEQWVESDLRYIETRSFSTDLGILARAVPAVLKAEGAY